MPAYLQGHIAPPAVLDQVSCHHCHALLGNERCAATTSGGPKWFCVADREHPQDSCYLNWRRMHR